MEEANEYADAIRYTGAAPAAPRPDDYIAWLRWAGDTQHRHLVLCDSDSPGAFRVYRGAAPDSAPPADELTHENCPCAPAQPISALEFCNCGESRPEPGWHHKDCMMLKAEAFAAHRTAAAEQRIGELCSEFPVEAETVQPLIAAIVHLSATPDGMLLLRAKLHTENLLQAERERNTLLVGLLRRVLDMKIGVGTDLFALNLLMRDIEEAIKPCPSA